MKTLAVFLTLASLAACGSINRATITLGDGSTTEFYLYNADAAAEATLPNGTTFKWNSSPNAAAIEASAQAQARAQQAMLEALVSALAVKQP